MRLKLNLLIPILDNSSGINKYSRAFINLKNVLDLEDRAKYKFKDKNVYSKFKELEKKYNDFINKIPLIVIERYYNDNRENTKKFINFEYQENEISDIRIMELYNSLEIFYSDAFSLACLIADLYNFEVKFNETSGDEENSDSNFF